MADIKQAVEMLKTPFNEVCRSSNTSVRGWNIDGIVEWSCNLQPEDVLADDWNLCGDEEEEPDGN